MEKKYEINCDYEAVLLLSDNSETLIGSSGKNHKQGTEEPGRAEFCCQGA